MFLPNSLIRSQCQEHTFLFHFVFDLQKIGYLQQERNVHFLLICFASLTISPSVRSSNLWFESIDMPNCLATFRIVFLLYEKSLFTVFMMFFDICCVLVNRKTIESTLGGGEKFDFF